MARTFAAGSTVGTTATTIFESDAHYRTVKSSSTNDGPACMAVNFDVASASAVPLGVNIPPIHGSDYYPIAVGASKEFVIVNSDLSANCHVINVKGIGGTATYSGGITA